MTRSPIAGRRSAPPLRRIGRLAGSRRGLAIRSRRSSSDLVHRRSCLGAHGAGQRRWRRAAAPLRRQMPPSWPSARRSPRRSRGAPAGPACRAPRSGGACTSPRAAAARLRAGACALPRLPASRAPSTRAAARARARACRGRSSPDVRRAAPRARSGSARAAAITDGFRPSRAGDFEREAASGRPVHELIGRRERVGVEPERRARDAVGRRRVGLERVVVARRDHASRRAGGSDRRSRRRARRLRSGRCPSRLRRAGPAPAAAAARSIDGDVRDVRREGAEARLDRLLVADVGEHRSEHRQRAIRRRRGSAAPTAPSARAAPRS